MRVFTSPSSGIPPIRRGNSIFTGDDLREWQRTLMKYLRLGALRLAAHSSHVSRAFMVPKPDGTKWLIVDLRPLNMHLANRRLRMVGLWDLAFHLPPGDHMIAWDVADAYFHVALFPSHVKYCTIRVNGHLWEIPVLPFGLKSSPYVLSKVVAPLVQFLCSPRLILHRQPPVWLPGLRKIWPLNSPVYILPYINDFLGTLTSRPQLNKFSKVLQQALCDLGLSLKTSKSILEPTTRIK